MKRIVLFWFVAGMLSVCSAQFEKNDIGIGGSLSWERSNQSGTSIVNIKPEINYFFFDNISVLISIQTIIYIFPRDWSSPPDLDAGFGLGSKYYWKNFYGGISFLFKQWNDYKPREHVLCEVGYLVQLNEKVFLDIGFDYQHGISAVNKKNSKTKLEIGVAVFL